MNWLETLGTAFFFFRDDPVYRNHSKVQNVSLGSMVELMDEQSYGS